MHLDRCADHSLNQRRRMNQHGSTAMQLSVQPSSAGQGAEDQHARWGWQDLPSCPSSEYAGTADSRPMSTLRDLCVLRAIKLYVLSSACEPHSPSSSPLTHGEMSDDERESEVHGPGAAPTGRVHR